MDLLLKMRLLKFHKKKENTSKLALLTSKLYHWAIFKQVTTILKVHCIDENLVFLKNEKMSGGRALRFGHNLNLK